MWWPKVGLEGWEVFFPPLICAAVIYMQVIVIAITVFRLSILAFAGSLARSINNTPVPTDHTHTHHRDLYSQSPCS